MHTMLEHLLSESRDMFWLVNGMIAPIAVDVHGEPKSASSATIKGPGIEME